MNEHRVCRDLRMDSFSDNSSRYELDSVTSTDSLHLITDEFRLRHVSTPDVSSAELSKRLAALEVENERLRVDLENSQVELNGRVVGNQSLKDKITELYIEAQASLQERLTLDNELKNAKRQVLAAENLKQWYQAQIHELQASKRGLQVEVDTYQRLVKEKHEVTLALTARCKQANDEYIVLSKKLRKERQELKEEIEQLRAKLTLGQAAAMPLKDPQTRLSPDLSTKLESTEDELRDTRVELKAMEQRLLSVEVQKNSLESALAKYRELISSMGINMEKCEMEKNEAKSRLNAVQIELNKVKSEKDVLESTLLNSKQEHGQVEQAIVQLKSQLNKMIAQHKLIKTRNIELESKAAVIQEIKNENKTLRSRSFAANSALFKKLRDAKRKIRYLEEQVNREDSRKQLFQARIETDSSLQECLKRALERNKELNDRLKLISMANKLEESIDEGYGDGFYQNITTEIPSPVPLNAELMHSVTQVLASGKNLLVPVQAGLEELHKKLETLDLGHRARFLNSGQMSSDSPTNSARIGTVTCNSRVIR
ncbi:myosin heavy chain, clone 203 isoform X1 [Neodiprion lecontei]|uniref:Myosin heavy chain, clone 203 isoform X1 n=1 Tax=Neodiprion lecontei TaxID=441921 RepID=A0ABM3GCB8_NEOLC|nr:myosin heavy chain, clone 203 isoform X1 [Neodiprion lecontei]